MLGVVNKLNSGILKIIFFHVTFKTVFHDLDFELLVPLFICTTVHYDAGTFLLSCALRLEGIPYETEKLFKVASN